MGVDRREHSTERRFHLKFERRSSGQFSGGLFWCSGVNKPLRARPFQRPTQNLQTTVRHHVLPSRTPRSRPSRGLESRQKANLAPDHAQHTKTRHPKNWREFRLSNFKRNRLSLSRCLRSSEDGFRKRKNVTMTVLCNAESVSSSHCGLKCVPAFRHRRSDWSNTSVTLENTPK